ncbi:hypothetical protein [Archaeoglobus sp.]
MWWYSATLFLITLITGLLEIASGLKGDVIIQMIPSDVFGGLILLTISAVLFRGLVTGDYKPFFYFGSTMLAIFSILYLLVLLANGLDTMIVGENWDPIDNFRVEIFLLPLAIPGLTSLIKAKKSLPP